MTVTESISHITDAGCITARLQYTMTIRAIGRAQRLVEALCWANCDVVMHCAISEHISDDSRIAESGIVT